MIQANRRAENEAVKGSVDQDRHKGDLFMERGTFQTTPIQKMNPNTSQKSRETVLPGEDLELDSVSEVDRELLVGERRESDWRDPRKTSAAEKSRDSSTEKGKKPVLEDGAD